ncbi:PAS domain S-box protein [Methylomonas sp. LL1]|uniref:PAS domain-containing response regulator n=1 Tax=Methylomonas sp. LL1 TaxID=2785785 RepID=UPI0018C35334|nr:PAS domain S-box protein [Methylomonas sp. LL1]QPK62810.1 PAS domain S-box protein [Methylomonas sp. LL1]
MNALPSIRLLLVDDDQIDRLACKRALMRHADCDFVIFEAETGNQGLNLARSQQIDCILLDFHLPDLSGVEFLAELAEETGDLPVPVVMLTGSDNAMIAVDALKLGARDYVVKGSDRESLQWLPAVVIRALHEQRVIQDKTQAVEQLREAEAKYRTLVEQIPAITYIASLDNPGQLLYVSPQIQQLGFPAEEWLNDPEGLLKRVHADDRPSVIEAYAQTYEHHTPLSCEYRLLKHNGQARWFLDEANVVRDEARGALCLQGLLVDITTDKETEQELYYYRRRLEELVAQRTDQLEKQSAILEAANASMDKELCERKRAEAALRNSETRFRLLLESAGEGIIGLDTEGRCTFVNHAALAMLGYAQEELLGQDTCATIHSGHADGSPVSKEQCSIYDAFRDSVPQRSSELFRRKGGGSFPVECTAHPMQLDGKVIGAVLVFRDMTESGS